VIVLDASAAADVLLNLGPRARRIRERMAASDNDLHVPHLFEVEVLSVLRRYSLRGELSQQRAHRAIDRLSSMRLMRYPHAALLSRVWELRENFTAYDAVYIALAGTLEAPLVTTDARLARAPGVGVAVEVYE
jgi:predicted nucleic acid-binding protein